MSNRLYCICNPKRECNMDYYYRLEHANSESRDFFIVNWCLSNICNYQCSYCIDVLHNKTVPFPDLSTVLSFCNQVIKSKQNKKILFEFTGGEVSIWEDFPELCKRLKSKNHVYIGMISNGSRSLSWWENIAANIDSVALSFHSEYATYEHFAAIIELLKQKSKVHVNIMVKPEAFDYCLEVAEKIASISGISLSLQPLIINLQNELFPYTAEQLTRLSSSEHIYSNAQEKHHLASSFRPRGLMKKIYLNGEDKLTSSESFIARKSNSWFLWKCAIGKEQIIVDMHGVAWRGWCFAGGSLGNIKEIGRAHV